MHNNLENIRFAQLFGTFPLTGKTLRDALHCAAEVGYRAIDTAQMYGNETEVGRALADSSVPTDEFYVVTKVSPDNFDSSSFVQSVETSLKRLRRSQIDLLLLHWPPADGDVRPSLELLQRCKDLGLVKDIGVSNYTLDMLDIAEQVLDCKLMTNQVEFHPLLDQSKLLRWSYEKQIPLCSFSAIARGRIFDEHVLKTLSEEHRRPINQIALRWILQKGVAVNCMSTKPANIASNFDILNFELSKEEMSQIDHLTAENYRVVDSNKVPWAPEWD